MGRKWSQKESELMWSRIEKPLTTGNDRKLLLAVQYNSWPLCFPLFLIINYIISYVGNLDPSVTEEFVATLFGQIGAVTKTKVIYDVS